MSPPSIESTHHFPLYLHRLYSWNFDFIHDISTWNAKWKLQEKSPSCNMISLLVALVLFRSFELPPFRMTDVQIVVKSTGLTRPTDYATVKSQQKSKSLFFSDILLLLWSLFYHQLILNLIFDFPQLSIVTFSILKVFVKLQVRIFPAISPYVVFAPPKKKWQGTSQEAELIMM